MKYFYSIVLVATLAALCPFGGVHALTIYRIGGADLPPPELDAPYEFVQLAWADVDEDRHASVEQLDLGPDRIAPQRLDPDVNLTPLIEERGGKIMILDWQAGWTPREPEDGLVFDGDPNTAYLGDGHYTRAPGYGPPNKLWIFDFGGRFLIERIRIYPRQAFLDDRFIERFLIGINDGDPLKDGTRDYPVVWHWQFVSLRNTGVDFDIVHDISENTQSLIELQIPPTPIQSLFFEAPENTRGIWEIAEFEIYGGGHAPFASYVSNVIDLGRPASLGDLVWSGNVEEGARIELNFHSGDDLDPNTYWRYTFRGDEKSRFDREGRLLDLQSFAKLERGEKAGITHDTENWSSWGAPLDFAAGAVDLGGGKPRSSVQFRADFESTSEETGQLDYVQFAVSAPPVVSAALAEIEPVEVRAGEATLFTYKVRPHFAVDDLGFDSIAIDTPERPLGVEAVRVDGEEVAYEVVRLDERGLAVRIAPVGLERTGDLIEVDFRAEVFRFGTVFSGRVFDSSKPYEVPQGVQGGDADLLADGAGLSVDLRDVSRETVRAIRLQSPIFTPNGDGVNDAVQIQYELLNVDRVSVVIEVYDLAGRKVAEVIDGKRASGRFKATWDGRGADGEPMPPGTYLLHLIVQTDGGRETAQRVVGLAY